jgi:hypothetical protein
MELAQREAIGRMVIWTSQPNKPPSKHLSEIRLPAIRPDIFPGSFRLPSPQSAPNLRHDERILPLIPHPPGTTRSCPPRRALTEPRLDGGGELSEIRHAQNPRFALAVVLVPGTPQRLCSPLATNNPPTLVGERLSLPGQLSRRIQHLFGRGNGAGCTPTDASDVCRDQLLTGRLIAS